MVDLLTFWKLKGKFKNYWKFGSMDEDAITLQCLPINIAVIMN